MDARKVWTFPHVVGTALPCPGPQQFSLRRRSPSFHTALLLPNALARGANQFRKPQFILRICNHGFSRGLLRTLGALRHSWEPQLLGFVYTNSFRYDLPCYVYDVVAMDASFSGGKAVDPAGVSNRLMILLSNVPQ